MLVFDNPNVSAIEKGNHGFYVFASEDSRNTTPCLRAPVQQTTNYAPILGMRYLFFSVVIVFTFFFAIQGVIGLCAYSINTTTKKCDREDNETSEHALQLLAIHAKQKSTNKMAMELVEKRIRQIGTVMERGMVFITTLELCVSSLGTETSTMLSDRSGSSM